VDEREAVERAFSEPSEQDRATIDAADRRPIAVKT